MRVSVKHYCLNCCRFAIVDSRHSSCSKRAHKTGMFVKMMSTEQHVDAVKSKNNIIKTIKSDVFVALKQLTNDTRAVRVKGAIDLLQQLHKKQNQSDENTIDKNRQYSLQRLVRGLGASSSSSRTGFYTAFVGLLSQPLTDNEYPSINHVIDVMEKELSVSKVGCNNKEDSDALVGRILVCAAIFRSQRPLTPKEIGACVQILINASHQKTFHASLAYTFLLELLISLDESQFTETVWPLMRKELKRPWEKQSINTLQFLIETQLKYPDIVDEEYLQSSLKSNEILSAGSYKHIGRLYWTPASAMVAATHSSHESFAKYLATGVPNKLLLRFWKSEVNELLSAPNKLKEIATLRILTGILNSKAVPIETVLELFSNSFIKTLVSSLKNSKQKKLEFIVRFHTEFFQAVEAFLESFVGNDTTIIAVIKRFICHPGTLLIEKYAPYRFVQHFTAKLTTNGVIEFFDVYKNILLEKTAKNSKDAAETWLHIEKQHCVHQMQSLIGLKVVHTECKWRTEQLKFLLKMSLFYVDKANQSIVTKEQDSGIITKELAQHIKHSFYVSLQTKGQNLADEKVALLALVQFCNDALSTKSAGKTLRKPLSDKALESWRKMYAKVTSIGARDTKLNTVFNVLLLHMALQLFQEPRMAQESIDDLEKCIERTQSKKKNSSEEPEWIEVIVDLFLHFLSQNTSFLRNIVANVFPQLCDNLSLTAMNQILSMLDMKEQNPLSISGGQADDDENENDEQEDDSDDGIDDSNNEAASDSDVESSDEEDEDIEIDDAEDEGEGTTTEQLRTILSSALGATTTETDADSVDLNDMDEDEAQRLDDALSNAFKLMGKKSGSDSVGSKKKTKRERTINTTVMHFRIRVLDLIEIYLKTSPSLMVTLEILLTLVSLTDHCRTNKDSEPLAQRSNHVMRTLLALRQFANVDDVTEANLADLLSNLVEAIPITVDEQHNSLLSRCMVFLIGCSQTLPTQKRRSAQPLLDALRDLMENFLKSRNTKVSINCFKAIINLRWTGAWQLGQTLVQSSLLAKEKARVFRRTQALILLQLLFKNHGFIGPFRNEFTKFCAPIESGIITYIKWLRDTKYVSSKEFDALLLLLTEILKCTTLYTSTMNWKDIGDYVQGLHEITSSCTHPVYVKLCKLLDIVPQPKLKNNNNDVTANDEKQKNGPSKRKSTPDNIASASTTTTNQHAKKLKKIKKEERLKLSSQGLDNVSFAAKKIAFGAAAADDDDGGEQNASASDSSN